MVYGLFVILQTLDPFNDSEALTAHFSLGALQTGPYFYGLLYLGCSLGPEVFQKADSG
jgi:hypothetical protein